MIMKYIKYLLFIFVCTSLTSCLEAGLEDLPTYTDTDITAFTFEYRWMVKEGTSEKLRVQKMDTDVKIDKEKNTVTCDITVPAVGKGIQEFTDEVREKVVLTALTGWCKLSVAAKIAPLGDAPVLGKIGDFSKKDMQYEVTAADGKTKKVWKLIITGFHK